MMSRLFCTGVLCGTIVVHGSTCEDAVADEFTTLQLNRMKINTHHSSPVEQMKLRHFVSSGDEDEDANAGILCGDGSISGYYWKSGLDGDRDKYLIWFQGGADPTSDTWPEYEDPIAPRFGEEFASWNQVYFRTCSNDARAGQRLTPGPDGQYYQGHLHVVNAINEMRSHISQRGVPPTKVLVGGCSGGSISTITNVDYIASQLPESAEIKAKTEAAMWFDAVTYEDFVANDFTNPSALGLNKESAEMMEAYVDESCFDELGVDWWKCRIFEHAAPHITTPIHFSEAKFDRTRIWERYGFDAPKSQHPSTYTDLQKGYFEYWEGRFTNVSNAVADAQPGWGYWMPSCVAHCQGTQLGTGLELTTSSGQISTPEAAFSNWYWQEDGEKFIMDGCTGEEPCNMHGWKCGKR